MKSNPQKDQENKNAQDFQMEEKQFQKEENHSKILIIAMLLIMSLCLLMAFQLYVSQKNTKQQLLKLNQRITKSEEERKRKLSKEKDDEKNDEKNDKKDKNKQLNIPQLPIAHIWLNRRPLNSDKITNARLQTAFYPKYYLKNYHWAKYGTRFQKYNLLIVHKVNILKLLYLYQNGGVYADLDAPFDYSCLMTILLDKKGFWMAGEPWNTEYPSAGNWILYASQKKDQKIKKVLDVIEEKLRTAKPNQLISNNIVDVSSLTGAIVLANEGVQKIEEIYTCANHFVRHSWLNQK